MYTTLQSLKAYVLPKPVQVRNDYDAALQEIGSGLAVRFNQYCHRTLLRGSYVDTIAGDRRIHVLRAYPVEEITAVETRADYGAAWSLETGMIDRLSPESGLVELDSSDFGDGAQLRIAYTGGYWVDLTGEDTLPIGATPLPHDLRLAWLNQAKHIFDLLDKDGDSFRGADRGLGGALVSLIQIDLLSGVEATLRQYKRYQII